MAFAMGSGLAHYSALHPGRAPVSATLRHATMVSIMIRDEHFHIPAPTFEACPPQTALHRAVVTERVRSSGASQIPKSG